MKTVVLLCAVGLVAANDARNGRIAVHGESAGIAGSCSSVH
jgi:hypothetical protein